MEKRPFVLGINGSPIVGESNTRNMLSRALAAAEQAGAQTLLVDLTEHIKVLFDGRREEHLPVNERIARLPQELPWLMRVMLEADGVIFATPTHCYNISSHTKVLLDWMMVTLDVEFVADKRDPFYPLNGKVGAAMAICEDEGAACADEKLIGPLLHMGFAIPPFGAYYRNKSAAAASEGNWQNEDQVLIGLNVVRMIRKLAGSGDWNDHSSSW